ncbi:MAG: hypothetical protein K0R57_1183 [Paenibacillaceae bacterium]|nr:hypothetical protein [Paenibacillaceae bacterium]
MLQVREAGSGDIPVMCALLAELFSLEKDFTSINDTAKQRVGLEMIMSRPESGQLMVLERNGAVIGMANLIFTISTAEGGKVIILEDYILSLQARGQGCGTYFMEQIVEYARRRGFLRITLLVDADNEPAQHFYTKAGYHFSNMRCMRLKV